MFLPKQAVQCLHVEYPVVMILSVLLSFYQDLSCGLILNKLTDKTKLQAKKKKELFTLAIAFPDVQKSQSKLREHDYQLKTSKLWLFYK